MKFPARLVSLISCVASAACLAGCGIDYLSTSQKVGYRTGPDFDDVPPDALTETLGGTRYFTHDGTYYRPKNGRYVATDPVF